MNAQCPLPYASVVGEGLISFAVELHSGYPHRFTYKTRSATELPCSPWHTWKAIVSKCGCGGARGQSFVCAAAAYSGEKATATHIFQKKKAFDIAVVLDDCAVDLVTFIHTSVEQKENPHPLHVETQPSCANLIEIQIRGSYMLLLVQVY